jgi:hypothetical protein
MLRARRAASSELEEYEGGKRQPDEARDSRGGFVPIKNETEATIHDFTPSHATTVVE